MLKDLFRKLSRAFLLRLINAGNFYSQMMALRMQVQKLPGVLPLNLGVGCDTSTIPANTFDCLILTQTLQTIFDLRSAVHTVLHCLKPGGVALVTTPGISKISRYDMDRWGYYWSFTTKSAYKMFEDVFPAANIQVNAYGNVLAAIAFLQGWAVEELKPGELDYIDPDYELLITVRAVKPAER